MYVCVCRGAWGERTWKVGPQPSRFLKRSSIGQELSRETSLASH